MKYFIVVKHNARLILNQVAIITLAASYLIDITREHYMVFILVGSYVW